MMAISPSFWIYKRLYRLEEIEHRNVLCGCDAIQRSIHGICFASVFEGSSVSMGFAFLINGLVSTILNAITVEQIKPNWKKDGKLRLALSAQDLICDGLLLATIAFWNPLSVKRQGVYVGLGFLGADALCTAWDAYWSCKGCKVERPLVDNVSEGLEEEGKVRSPASIEISPSVAVV